MITNVILQTYRRSDWLHDLDCEIFCKQWDSLFALECGDVILSFFTLRIGEFL